MCSLLPSGLLALRGCTFSVTMLLAKNFKIYMYMYFYEEAVPRVGDLTKANLRTAPCPQLCTSSWKVEPEERVLCWHRVGCVEERPLFESHGAAARPEPSTDPVSHSWRRFPGTAGRITAARTVKGNEERELHVWRK